MSLTRRVGVQIEPARPTLVRNFVNKSISLMLALLTGVELLSLVSPAALTPGLKTLATVLLVAFVPLAVIKARRISLVLFLLTSALVLSLVWHNGRWELLWSGVSHAVVFGAFLTVLQLLRNLASRSSAIREVKSRFYDLSERQVLGGFAVGSFAVGSFLGTGAHAVLAPLLGPEVTFRNRRTIALTALRSFSFAAFWSPFISPVAFVTQQLPQIGSAIIIGGLVCGLIGLTIELTLSGIRLSSLGPILRGLRPLVPGAAAVALGLIAVTWWGHLNTIEAVVLVVPLLATGFFLWNGPAQGREILGAAYSGVAYASDELMVLTGATTFAIVMGNMPGVAEFLAPQLADTAPILLMALIAGFMLLTSAVGCHPSIPAALLINLFAALPLSVDRLALALTLVVTWCLAAMVSPVGITVVVAGQMYRIPYLDLILSRNIINVVAASTVTVLLMAGLDGLSSHALPALLALWY